MLGDADDARCACGMSSVMAPSLESPLGVESEWWSIRKILKRHHNCQSHDDAWFVHCAMDDASPLSRTLVCRPQWITREPLLEGGEGRLYKYD